MTRTFVGTWANRTQSLSLLSRASPTSTSVARIARIGATAGLRNEHPARSLGCRRARRGCCRLRTDPRRRPGGHFDVSSPSRDCQGQPGEGSQRSRSARAPLSGSECSHRRRLAGRCPGRLTGARAFDLLDRGRRHVDARNCREPPAGHESQPRPKLQTCRTTWRRPLRTARGSLGMASMPPSPRATIGAGRSSTSRMQSLS